MATWCELSFVDTEILRSETTQGGRGREVEEDKEEMEKTGNGASQHCCQTPRILRLPRRASVSEPTPARPSCFALEIDVFPPDTKN